MNSPITIDLSDDLSVRLYSDSRPNYLETAPLQKGLVLVFKGKELIEEGMGFGTPVVLCKNRAFFSSSAETQVYQIGNIKILTKKFVIDSISRKKIRDRFYINDSLYGYFHKWFHRIYTEHKDLALIFMKLIEFLRKTGVNTEFQKIPPKGIITVKYSCSLDSIKVEVSLAELQGDCLEIAVLNEQGASTFRKYSDTKGLTLLDTQIGAWERVDASEASLSQINDALSFSVQNHDQLKLFRGREKIKRQYSWVGFCYYISPKNKTFQYSIKLKTGSD